MASSTSDILQSPTRDTDYYISDGNTVIQVETTLFKVHRSILMADNSTFFSMFSLESHTRSNDSGQEGRRKECEGESDTNPIYLQGDTADEFHSLLWSLYALPDEIASAMTINDETDEMLLIRLSRVAHKYQFKSIESWSLQILIALHKSTPAFDNPISLTELAVLCNSHTLRDIAVLKWKRLLVEGKMEAAAINIAERLDLRSLQGLGYYSMMLRGRDVWDSDPLLNRSHRIRLLSGHYTLVMLCESLATSPPLLKHRGCLRKERASCHFAWQCLWKSINNARDGGLAGQVLTLLNADLVGRLMLAESVLKALLSHDIPAGNLLDGVSANCLAAGLEAAQAKTAEVQESLADWFTDVK